MLNQHYEMIVHMAAKSKGPRHQFTVRVPVDFAKIILEKAEKEGFDSGEIMLELAARALDMPQYSPASKRANQLDIPEEADSRAA